MKHKLGNTPKCADCYFYREKEADDFCIGDGYCLQKKHFERDCSGRKRVNCPEKWPTKKVHCCEWWEDAETRQSHFEVMTMGYEPKKIGGD